MKVALVTGASAGIGKSIALQLLKDGYHVAITGRSLKTLESAFPKEEVDQTRIFCIQADATNFESYSQIVAGTILAFGQLDLLVNNVGGATLKQTIETSTLADWNEAISLNATSVFFTIQAAIPHLKKSSCGTIVNFSSILASRPIPGLGPYSASKAAVEMLTKTVAMELAPFGIRVLCISPATIQTNFHTNAGMSFEAAEKYYEASKSTHPIGRIGQPEDVSQLVSFLADSSKSGFMTGSVIHLDGGRMMTSATGSGLR